MPIPTFPFALSKTKSDAPPKLPPLLNCNCPLDPPGVPLPPPVPKQVPFTETQPPVIAIPPANVEVDVFVTVRFVSDVVPRLPIIIFVNVAPSIVPPLIEVFVIDPPLIVGLFITVFVSWSIL